MKVFQSFYPKSFFPSAQHSQIKIKKRREIKVTKTRTLQTDETVSKKSFNSMRSTMRFSSNFCYGKQLRQKLCNLLDCRLVCDMNRGRLVCANPFYHPERRDTFYYHTLRFLPSNDGLNDRIKINVDLSDQNYG